MPQAIANRQPVQWRPHPVHSVELSQSAKSLHQHRVLENAADVGDEDRVGGGRQRNSDKYRPVMPRRYRNRAPISNNRGNLGPSMQTSRVLSRI
jgi:hypothetical protein